MEQEGGFILKQKISAINLWVFVGIEIFFGLYFKYKNPSHSLDDEFFFFWAIMAFFFGMVGYFGLERRGTQPGMRLYDQLNNHELDTWYKNLTSKTVARRANDALLAIPLGVNLLIYFILIQF